MNLIDRSAGSVKSTFQDGQVTYLGQPSEALGWLLFGVLILQYMVSVSLTYHSKPFWLDEVCTYYTASVASVGRIIQVQMTSPLAVEPPINDILAHAFLVVFPNHHKVIRIPGAIGFFVLVLCTFFFMRRLGGIKLALISTALLLASQSLYYASEGRPYGVALGMWGAALLSWQSARRNQRTLPLVALAATIAIAINDHYFALLMPIPIAIAELARFRQRGYRPVRVLLAISVGYASTFLWLPFLRAGSQYGTDHPFHLYQLKNAYKFLLISLPASKYVGGFISALFVLFVFIGVSVMVRREAFKDSEGGAEWIALCFSCLIPFVGAALAYMLRGPLEPRYVLYAITGFCAFAAAGIGSLFQRTTWSYLAVILILAVAGAQEVSVIQENRAATRRENQPLPPTPPGDIVVIADYGKFLAMESEHDRYSAPLAYVYDREQEIRYFHTGFTSHAVLNAAAITSLPVYDADGFLASNSSFIVAGWRDYESWWYHSWNDKNLRVDSFEKVGPWTLYYVSVIPALPH